MLYYYAIDDLSKRYIIYYMKKIVFVSASLIGINALLSQVILIRELLVNFSGNELTIGIIFAIWFLGGAIGSLFVSKRIISRIKKNYDMLLLGFLSSTIAIPIAIFLSRTLKTFLQILAYEVVTPFQILIISSIVLVPISCILTTCLILCYRLFEDSGIAKQKAGLLYALDAIGATTAGALFTFIIVKYAGSFQVAYGLMVLNLIFLVWAAKRLHKRIYFYSFILILLLLVSSFNRLAKIETISQSIQWQGQDIISYINSPHGNITATKISGVSNLYENGSLISSTEDDAFNEEFIHLVMLQHANPENILLIGGGAGGCLKEILKYNPTEIVYLELDPLLVDISKQISSDANKAALTDRKVKIIYEDARLYLKKSAKRFDIIITNLPDPSTLQLNRFYTKQFYLLSKNLLKENGIFATKISAKESIISNELARYISSIYKTLDNAFEHVGLIPGESLILLASKNNRIDRQGSQILIERFKQRKIVSSFLTTYHIKDRYYPDSLEYLKERIAAQSKKTRLNLDFYPTSFYYNIVMQYALSYPHAVKSFNRLSDISIIYVIIAIVFLFILIYKIAYIKKDQLSFLVPTAIGICGACAIILEIVIILCFQISYGYVYEKIGFLISVFMLGLAFGAYLADRLVSDKTSSLKILRIIVLSFSIYIISLPFIIKGLAHLPFEAMQFFFYPMMLVSGLAIGSQFSIGISILRDRASISKTAANIWGADLLGAIFGTLVGSLVFIPIFGIFQTLGICSLLSIGSLLLILFPHQRPQL